MNVEIGDVILELNSSVDLKLRNELLENAKTILTTLRGTNPQNRAMGLVSEDIIGRKYPVAKGAYSVQAIEQIGIYEPRLTVVRVQFELDGQKLIPKVVCTYNGS